MVYSLGHEVSYDPNPFPDVNGCEARINYSDAETRNTKKPHCIYERIKMLRDHHSDNSKCFGSKQKILTRHNETSRIDTFSYGNGTRNITVRIPSNQTCYLEYRLPAADLDPYIAIGLMFAEF